MRSLRVVEASPLLDQYLRLPQRVEDFHVQALISELAVEALIVAVLPRATRRDEQGFDLKSAEPMTHGLGNKLGPVVRSYMLRWAMLQEELRQHMQDILAVQLPPHVDRQAIACVLGDDGEHREHLAVMGAILNKIVGPDMALVGWPQSGAVTLSNRSRVNLAGSLGRAAAVTVCHTLIASLRNWRNVFREIRWRWTLNVL